MRTLSTQHKAILALTLTALLWSLGGVLIKAITWNPIAIAGVRSAIATLVLWGLFHNTLRFTFSYYQLGAAVAYASTMLSFVIATKLTSAANAIFLQYTAPVYVALLSGWFLKRTSHQFRHRYHHPHPQRHVALFLRSAHISRA
ncbi:MAG: DMT family transporter, partial [Candidatus Competibacteraceae bacterium]|nr:DMT family transporter [Candidatus Competibacteraceae bacterium]